MRFSGMYTERTENGKVDFPWQIYSEEKLIWLIVEITKNNLTTRHCEIWNSHEVEEKLKEVKQHPEEIKIINEGDVFLDAYEKWQVPEEVLNYLKTDEITFLGAFHFIEILSSEDIKQYEEFISASEESLSF